MTFFDDTNICFPGDESLLSGQCDFKGGYEEEHNACDHASLCKSCYRYHCKNDMKNNCCLDCLKQHELMKEKREKEEREKKIREVRAKRERAAWNERVRLLKAERERIWGSDVRWWKNHRCCADCQRPLRLGSRYSQCGSCYWEQMQQEEDEQQEEKKDEMKKVTDKK